MISKTQIDKLGERIRNEHPNINENTIITLQDLRTSHKDTLSDIFNNLGLMDKIAHIFCLLPRFRNLFGL